MMLAHLNPMLWRAYSKGKHCHGSLLSSIQLSYKLFSKTVGVSRSNFIKIFRWKGRYFCNIRHTTTWLSGVTSGRCKKCLTLGMVLITVYVQELQRIIKKEVQIYSPRPPSIFHTHCLPNKRSPLELPKHG